MKKNIRIIFQAIKSMLKKCVKRFADVSVSALALVIGSPIILLTAAAIKLDSPGPVLYSQPRVGKNGKLFNFWKFRSMVQNADEILFSNPELYKKMRSGSHKLKDDPRITRAGRIIRRTSIDELPQFWNVLRGDMSFVGPRAYRPDEVDLYMKKKKSRIKKLFPKVFLVKPGITGLWQVSGRSKLSFEQRVHLDAKYAETWTIFGDLKIILKTPEAVFKGEGAM